MIKFALPVPHDQIISLHVPDAVLFIPESLDLQQRNLYRSHVLVNNPYFEFGLVSGAGPQDLVDHCLGSPQLLLLDGLELMLVRTLDDEGVVFVG